MKKVLLAILVIFLLPISVTGSDGLLKMVKATYPIFVDSKEISNEHPIVNYNGRTYVPLRKVSEELNCKVKWDNEKKEVSIVDTNKKIISDLFRCVSKHKEIDGISYKFRADISKDTMPGNNLKMLLQRGIAVYVKAVNIETDQVIPFPKNIQIDRVWVMIDDYVEDIKLLNQGVVVESEDVELYRINSYYFPFDRYNQYESHLNIYIRLFNSTKNEYFLLESSNIKVAITS